MTRLHPEHFHAEYPNWRTIRLLVSAPGLSTFIEVPADESAAAALIRLLGEQGMGADPEDVRAAIEGA